MVLINTGEYAAIFIDGSGDIDIEVFYQDSSGTAVDLTGYLLTWTFTIEGVTLTATVGSGLTLVAAAGKITLHFEKSVATTLPQGLGKHKLFTTTPVDKVLFKGALINDT